MAGRKPIHLEMKGTKDNRQLIWEAVRGEQRPFTVQQIAWTVELDLETTRYCIQGLQRAGFIGIAGEKATRGKEQLLELIKDCGVEAPPVTRSGKPSVIGMGTEAMWRSLRILGEVSADELAAQASVSAKTTQRTASSYLLWLHRAGYVIEISAAASGPRGRTARYRLAPGKYTGPRAPMIQRIGQLYDPNLGEVVYSQMEGAQA
uniref:Uncharacterized protein n=1 Tax=viral metagenome TaxID=1070528 RepID=A0A6H1ZEK8_9ZZZZ